MAPRLSIVMPARQAEAHIAEAIESVLAQDWGPLELIVVDDRSTDGTRAIAEAAARADDRVRVLDGAGRGAGAARDAGIAQARAPLVLLADADDRCDPDHAGALARALLDDPSADLVFARCRYVDGAGRIEAVQGPQPDRIGPRDLLRGVMINTPLVRRAAIRAVGGHDADLPGSIDLDLFVRLAMRRRGAIRALDRVSSDYRRGGGQITSEWARMARSWERVVEKAVAAGLDLPAPEMSRMRGRHCAYWSTLAYKAGDYAAARRLIAEAAWRVPGYVATDGLARVRAAACLASLLPPPLHRKLRARWNGGAGT